MRTLLLALILALVCPAPASPQADGQAAATSPVEAARPGQAPPPPENYSYEPAGRRDPFRSLIGTGTDPQIASRRPDGAAGLLVNEVSVRGVVQSRGALVAAVQGPDNKTYLLRPGDKLMDGTVKAVSTQGLTIVQQVNDPLSTVKQREVHKLLRSLEDAQ